MKIKRRKYQVGGTAAADTTRVAPKTFRKAMPGLMSGQRYNSMQEAADAYQGYHPGTGEVFAYPTPKDSTQSFQHRTYRPGKGGMQEVSPGTSTQEIMDQNYRAKFPTVDEYMQRRKKFNLGGLAVAPIQRSAEDMLGANFSIQNPALQATAVAPEQSGGGLGGILKGAVGAAGGLLGGPLGSTAVGLVGNLIGGIGSKKREREAAEAQASANYRNQIRGGRLAENAAQPQYDTMFAMGGQVDVNQLAMQQAQGVPIEVEGGETMEMPNGQGMAVQGPGHAEGGVDATVPEQTKIFSDRITVPGSKETFADAHKKMLKKVSKFEKILEDPKATELARKTAKKMLSRIQGDENSLFELQQSISHDRTPTKQEFADGGLVDYDNPLVQGSDEFSMPRGFQLDYDNPLVQGSNKFSTPGSGGIREKLSNTDWGNVTNTAGTLAPALYNIGSGIFGKTQNMNPQDFANPYEGSAIAAMQNRSINVDPLIEENRAAATTARYNLRNAARTRGEMLGGYAPIAAGEARGNAAARLQKQQMENQYAGEAASMQANLGAQRAATTMQVADMNVQNRAAKRRMTSEGLTQLGQYSQIRQQAKNMKETDSMRIDTLKMMYPEIWPKLEALINENSGDKKSGKNTKKN